MVGLEVANLVVARSPSGNAGECGLSTGYKKCRWWTIGYENNKGGELEGRLHIFFCVFLVVGVWVYIKAGMGEIDGKVVTEDCTC